MSNIEAQFLKKLLQDNAYSIVADKQITDRYLTGRYRSGFKFIREHVAQYGKVPDPKVFAKKFPSFPFPDEMPEEGMDYFCDELRQKTKHNMIVGALEDVEEDIQNLDPEAAYKKLMSLVLKVENEVILSDRQSSNKNTDKRMESYRKRANAGGMTGIPSFIDRIDYILKGFNKKELITLLGYTGTGKSWFEIICAVAQAKAGFRVLFFTTEMAAEMVQRRIDAVGAHLNYTQFRDGKLHPEDLARYEEYLEYMEGNEDFVLDVEQATGGVSQIAAKIDQYKPDMVYIDGAYLLADDEAAADEGDGWKNLVHIWRGLHRLCIAKDVPIFASTQSKERKISLAAISFAKAIAADCDVVMGLEQDEQMYEDREIKVTFHKLREGTIPGAIMMNWDFDRMDYSTIYMEGNDPVKEQQAKQHQEDTKAAKQETQQHVKQAGKARMQVARKPVGRVTAAKPPGVQQLA